MLPCNPVFDRDMKYCCRVNQAVVHWILLYGCEMWPIQVADEGILPDFNNDHIPHIPHVRRRDGVPTVELQYAGTARPTKAPLV